MAKIELKFLDFSDESWLKVTKEGTQEDQYIEIDVYDDVACHYSAVYLDKSTAIKFAKTLRTEINKIKD